MRILVCFLCFIFFFKNVRAQDEVISIDLSLLTEQETGKNFVPDETVALTDKKTNRTAFLLFGGSSIYTYFYSEKNQLLNSFKLDDIPSEFKHILGYFFKENKLIVLMNSGFNSNYGYLEIDYDLSKSDISRFDFKFNKEKNLRVISREDGIYFLTAYKKESELYLYKFSGSMPLKTKLKVPENTFIDRFGRSIEFHNAIYKRDLITNPSFAEIEKNVPITIEESQNLIKYYEGKDSFIMTIDGDPKKTYIFQISYHNPKLQITNIPQPLADYKHSVKSNSFLYQDKLFQIIMTSDKMQWKVSNIQTKEVLKQDSVERKEEIDFKNTVITQEGGEFTNYKELEKTQQFFRKVMQGNIGLTVFKTDDKYEVSFGSFEVLAEGNYINLYGGGLIGGVLSVFLSDLTDSFLHYRNTKSVYFTGLFNENFEHIQGDVRKENIFDKILNFSLDKKVNSETLYNNLGVYYWGYFDKDNNKYKVFSFEE